MNKKKSFLSRLLSGMFGNIPSKDSISSSHNRLKGARFCITYPHNCSDRIGLVSTLHTRSEGLQEANSVQIAIPMYFLGCTSWGCMELSPSRRSIWPIYRYCQTTRISLSTGICQLNSFFARMYRSRVAHDLGEWRFCLRAPVRK